VQLVHLDGLDSLLSIVQMPGGVPVATVGVGNARNAGLLAVRILATSDPELRARLDDHRAELRESSKTKGESLKRRRSAPTGFSA
jgi:5-(carboxyamino)imidazole ribonucleotide mutase